MDDVRHNALDVTVALGVILRRRKIVARSVSRSLAAVPPLLENRARPRHRGRQTIPNESQAFPLASFPRRRPPSRARTRRHARTPTPRPDDRAARALRSSTAHLLAMLRRALAGVGVGAENRPLTLAARANHATHGLGWASRRGGCASRASRRGAGAGPHVRISSPNDLSPSPSHDSRPIQESITNTRAKILAFERPRRPSTPTRDRPVGPTSTVTRRARATRVVDAALDEDARLARDLERVTASEASPSVRASARARRAWARSTEERARALGEPGGGETR